jgi:molybdopterin-containing oxidoreductase family membrane subunit
LGWDITNFVWWVGIGHAGTLISAVLLLFRHDGEWQLTVLLKQ